jgi:ATP-dependent Clp endopeptidase proteolytic subunit ClpP
VKHEIFINGYIGEMFDFFGDGNSFSLKTLNEHLANIPAEAKEIEVHINSGGGLVSEGFAIYDKLVNQSLPVTTIVEGMCGSIATIIAQAGKKGSRKMFQNSDYFIHNPLWIPSAPDAHNADDLEKLTEELRKNEEKILDFYVKTTGADRTVLSEKMKAESTLTSAEAKALGFIDEVISTDVVAMVRYKIAAAVQTQTTKTNTMSELKTEIKAGFTKLENLFAKLIKKTFVAVKTSEGVDIFYDGELKMGSKVYSDEAMTTPAPDGVHTVGDKVFTIAGGEVTKEEEVVAQKTELEIANEKIAELTASLEAKNGEVTSAKAEVETVLATATELEKEFVAFKTKIITGDKEIFVATVDKPAPAPAKDWRNEVVELRKAQAEKNKK